MWMRWWLVIVAWSLALVSAGVAGEVAFEFRLDSEAVTSSSVFSPQGQMVRALLSLKKLPPGRQSGRWDGLDDLGRNVPPGPYEIRIAIGRAQYHSVGTIGNSGVGRPMQAGTDDLIIDRQTGDIYTANNWEEAGQDFRKMDAQGKHLMDARFQVRNGTPNGWPIAVALDQDILYCSVFTVNETLPGQTRTFNGGAVIRRFSADKGIPIKFPTPTGFIRVKVPDPAQEKPFDHQSLHSLTVCGDVLVAADRDTGTVYKFDKKTGQALGTFVLKRPTCVISDHERRLWFSYDEGKIVVTDLSGKVLARPQVPTRKIVCLRLAGKDRLWVADQDAGQLQVYRIDALDRLAPLRTYGKKAGPGDFSPLAISRIQSFDVTNDGGFVLAQTYGHGSIVTRFKADSAVVWQQVGLEFCTNGTYDQKQPDLFISSLLHAYRLLDPAQGTWKYEGNLLGTHPLRPGQSTGTPRVLQINKHQYYYQLTGDHVKVYRVEGSRAVPAALVGISPCAWDTELLGPMADKDRPTHYSWNDANGDGQIQREEISRVVDQTPIWTFSCEVDAAGNLIIPDHQTSSIYRLPLTKWDEHGNPIYDWSALRVLLPRDRTLRGLKPMKACPLPDGGLYVLQVADHSFYPPFARETGFGKDYQVCWMGGWVLSKYDRQGQRLFTVPLPEHCTGMDWIPNVGRTEDRGVLAGCYSALKLFHYSPDGLLLGVFGPRHTTGWLDHNGSLSINRNPGDGLVDIFAEESLCNRISWYRMEDRQVTTLKVPVRKEPAPGQMYSEEGQFYRLLATAQDHLQHRLFAEACQAFGQALELAVPREKPFVQEQLARACVQARDLAQAVEHFQAAIDTPGYVSTNKIDLFFEISDLLEQQKQHDRAIAFLKRLMDSPTPQEGHYGPRARLRIAGILRVQNKLEEALTQYKAVKDHLAKTHTSAPTIQGEACLLAGDTLRQQKKDAEAIQEYAQVLLIKERDENQAVSARMRMAACFQALHDLAKAAEQFTAAAELHPKADLNVRAECLSPGRGLPGAPGAQGHRSESLLSSE